MNLLMRYRIKRLVEDTNAAFCSCDHLNMDYAAFASMAISDFKDILKNPALTPQDLRRAIRTGHKQHKSDNPKGCWATFVAGHIAQSCNENLEDRFQYKLKDLYKEKP